MYEYHKCSDQLNIYVYNIPNHMQHISLCYKTCIFCLLVQLCQMSIDDKR